MRLLTRLPGVLTDRSLRRGRFPGRCRVHRRLRVAALLDWIQDRRCAQDRIGRQGLAGRVGDIHRRLRTPSGRRRWGRHVPASLPSARLFPDAIRGGQDRTRPSLARARAGRLLRGNRVQPVHLPGLGRPFVGDARGDQAFDGVGSGAVASHFLLAGDLIAELRVRGDGFEPELLPVILGQVERSWNHGRGGRRRHDLVGLDLLQLLRGRGRLRDGNGRGDVGRGAIRAGSLDGRGRRIDPAREPGDRSGGRALSRGSRLGRPRTRHLVGGLLLLVTAAVVRVDRADDLAVAGEHRL